MQNKFEVFLAVLSCTETLVWNTQCERFAAGMPVFHSAPAVAAGNTWAQQPDYRVL